MKTSTPSLSFRCPFGSPSFALISVLALVSLAALTATAFLASARLERTATRPLGEKVRLEMALNIGFNCAKEIINSSMGSSYDTVATYWRTNPADDVGYLLSGYPRNLAESTTPTPQMYWFAAFSTARMTELATNAPPTAVMTNRVTVDNQSMFSNTISNFMAGLTNFGTNGSTNIELIGHTSANPRLSPPVGWMTIKQPVRTTPGKTNTVSTPVMRIAFFTEDLSGLIDAERMCGSTTRDTGTNPTEISMTNIGPTPGITFGTATNTCATYLTPSLLASNGPIATTNLRYFATGLRSWTNAVQRVPRAIAIAPGTCYGRAQGDPTVTNGAKFLIPTNPTASDVAIIAAALTSNLTTNFLARAGGLTNRILYTTNDDFDYAKCLAANIVDYIDPDSIPTALDAAQGYRGTEALPYLTELAMRIRLEQDGTTYSTYNDVVIGGTPTTPPTLPSNRIKPSFNLYYEFWNPYNVSIPLSQLTISFKSYGTNSLGNTNGLAMGCNQFVQPIESLATAYQDGASGSLTNMVFDFSTASSTNVVGVSNNALGPNSYCMIRCKNNSDWTNIASSTTNWSFTNNNGTNEYRFIYGNNNTRRVVYVAQLTTNFSKACIQNNGSTISANQDYPTTGLCELAFSNKTYDRARNLLLRAQTIDAGGSYGPNTSPAWFLWRPGLLLANGILPTNNTGDPRITYFLRPSNSSTLHNYTSWPNTNGTFGGPNPNLSIPTWPDQGHPPLNFGLASTNEPILGNVTVTNTDTNRAPGFIRNGPMTNILELGNIYDPILWRGLTNGNVTTNSTNDPRFGGGNTLRIGRAEHPRFAFTNLGGATDLPIPNMGQSAAALLDIFCTTNAIDDGGKININTASGPVLAALAGGISLKSDLAKVGTEVNTTMVAAFTNGVMKFRQTYPFYSTSQLPFISTNYGSANWTNGWFASAVFSTNTGCGLNGITELNDQGMEEWFSKIYGLSSVQSRNFRIYVYAQMVNSNNVPYGRIMRKYYHLYTEQTAEGPNDIYNDAGYSMIPERESEY